MKLYIPRIDYNDDVTVIVESFLSINKLFFEFFFLKSM